jgi:hypothetical protein
MNSKSFFITVLAIALAVEATVLTAAYFGADEVECESGPANVEMNKSGTCYMNVTAECVGGECSSESGVNVSDNTTENTTVIADPQLVKKNDISSVKSSKDKELLSLEYWRSWIEKVIQ